MATLSDLTNAVSTLLRLPGVGATLQLNSNTKERAFEAYVFALTIEAVRLAGGTVQLVGVVSGPSPQVVVFRGAPGQMRSTAQDFCYAACSLNSKDFEVHVDVKYEGASHAEHEVDVAIYDATKAAAVRARGTLPPASGLIAALECKFYESALGTVLGREFVGLISDFSGCKIKFFVSNGRGQGIARYFAPTARPNPVFEVSPLIPSHRDRLVKAIEQGLRKWAGVW